MQLFLTDINIDIDYDGICDVNCDLNSDRVVDYNIDTDISCPEGYVQDGDYCLFEVYKGGSREGKIVLAEHIGQTDEDYRGSHTIKEYHSVKRFDEWGNWEHEAISLQPLNKNYPTLTIDADDADSLRIIGEFIETI